MFVHVFSFRWKQHASKVQRQRAVSDILAFNGAIAGLQQVWLGDNVSPNSPDYSTTGVMAFADRAAFEAYTVHPRHTALLEWLVPLIEAIELDFTPIA